MPILADACGVASFNVAVAQGCNGKWAVWHRELDHTTSLDSEQNDFHAPPKAIFEDFEMCAMMHGMTCSRSHPTNRIVAELDPSILARLDGRSKSVRLSQQTAAKQAERHPDVAPEAYDRLQYLFDRGTVVLEQPRTLVFMAELGEGKWWRAVVKCTADRRQTFLVTFHRIKPRQIAAGCRRGVIVRLGEGMTAPGGAQNLLARPEPRV